jgi:CoA:oxalate CoA-transferase
MGFGWPTLSTLNPRLVYCTITGFGYSESPLRDRGAFTPIVEAMSGSVIYRTREEPPSIAGYPIGDLFPAGLAVAAIGMALYRREHDGLGARIDMAMYDAMVSLNERAIGMSAMLDRDMLPGVVTDLGSSPAGLFRAKDGYIALAVVGEPIWQRLCRVMERPDWSEDPGLASGPARAERHFGEVLPGIERWLASRTRAEAVRELNAAGVPAGEVERPREVVVSDQASRREMIIDYPTYRDGVSATVTGNPVRFAGEPAAPPGPAPAPGEHTSEILLDWARLDRDELESLLADGVVGAAQVSR